MAVRLLHRCIVDARGASQCKLGSARAEDHAFEYSPFPPQREFLEYMDGHRPGRPAEAMCVWPRRHGKDLTGLEHLLVKAHDTVGAYWHALPTYEQARKSCWTAFRNDLHKRLMDSVFPREIVLRPREWAPEASMLVELRNGSIVQFVGADSIDSIVGAGISGLNASEYSLWRPNAYDLIRPMLRESGGWTAFFMTPRGHNHAWRQYQLMRADPRKFVSHRDIFTFGKYTPEAARALIEDELRSGMLPELVRQEYMTDFAAAMVGSYWGDVLEALEKHGSLGDFPHAAGPAFVSFDLGVSDSTAVWAYVPTAGGADFVAHYENHSKPAMHYLTVLRQWARPPPEGLGLSYRGATMWLPHDARARTFVTGESVAERMVALEKELGLGFAQVDIAPELGRLEGIESARALLIGETRIHRRCDEVGGPFGRSGTEALRQYHRNYDEKRKVFMNEPEHDWSSHTADAFRYAAVSMRISRQRMQAAVPKPRPTMPSRQVYIGMLPPLDEAPRRRRERWGSR